jgi:hypothetical protein
MREVRNPFASPLGEYIWRGKVGCLDGPAGCVETSLTEACNVHVAGDLVISFWECHIQELPTWLKDQFETEARSESGRRLTERVRDLGELGVGIYQWTLYMSCIAFPCGSAVAVLQQAGVSAMAMPLNFSMKLVEVVDKAAKSAWMTTFSYRRSLRNRMSARET